MSQDEKKYNASVSFAEYGKSFQEKVVQALLVDWKFAEQMLEVIDVSYFELKYLVFLVDRYFAYAKKYKVFPTLQLLVTIIKDDLKAGTDMNLRDQIIDYLQRMRANPDPGDLQYVKEKSLEFCRKQALKAALENAVDQMAANKYESIVEGIKKATLVGTAPALGHDFFLDFEARFTRLQRSAVATGIDELDKKEIMNGGLGKGEIGVVIAPTGVGKSHFLVMLGSNAIRAGVDVLHYTFELSEPAVGMRYDSNLCDIDSNLVIENKDKVIESYKDAKLGRLMIKEFPSNTATIYTIRSHIERLDVKGFKPGLIIIDYADIMRSTRQYDSLRHELKLIYEELRAFAMEKGVPVWTACFHGDTIIKTPCGDEKISSLVGKSGFPVYSYNHDVGRVELRTVKSVYESGKNVEVWKVTLDNGESVIVTPNHKFMKRDGTYCEVSDLNVGDSLMPFNERISNTNMPGRKEIYRNDGSWEYVYKMVAKWKWSNIPKFHQVHHKDFDKTNDHPDNLELLTISEHYKVHSRVQWDSHIPCSLDHLREVYSERMKRDNPMFNPEIKLKAGRNRKGKCMGDDNPMKLEENKRKVSESLQLSEKFAAYKITVPEKVTKIWNDRNEIDRKRIGAKIQMTRFGNTREDRIKQHIKIASQCKTFDEFKERTVNIPLRGGDKFVIWSNRNHKIVSIEPHGRADVFNMEVDELHNYAIGAGIIVKNSQSNKEGATSDIVDLGNMSEAYGKAMVADVVLSISRKAHEKSSGWGRLYIAKNRAGRDGIVYPVKIDTARSKFDIAGRAGSLEEAVTDDEDAVKKALRTKWRELKSELKFEPKGPPVVINEDKKKDDDEGNDGSKPN